jgi:hypothetical protein
MCTYLIQKCLVAYICLNLKAYDSEIRTVKVIEYICIEFVVGSKEIKNLLVFLTITCI